MDVNDLAIRTCFTQEYDNKKHPIAYYSKKISEMEQNYNIHDKKLLAIIEAFKQWWWYCERALKFDVYIDHKNLQHFTTTKVLNWRQVCWMGLLMNLISQSIIPQEEKMNELMLWTNDQILWIKKNKIMLY